MFEENISVKKRNLLSNWVSKKRYTELQQEKNQKEKGESKRKSQKKKVGIKRKQIEEEEEEKEEEENKEEEEKEEEERGIEINFYKKRMEKNPVYATREQKYGARKRKTYVMHASLSLSLSLLIFYF